jgi:predicted phosphodiesterase
LNAVFNGGSEEKPYIVGLTHGHLAKQCNRVTEWWAHQVHGQQAIGAAQLLISGHWHHLRVEDTGTSKTWLQLPAFDGGSAWFRRGKGEDNAAGMVTLDIAGVWTRLDQFRIWE